MRYTDDRRKEEDMVKVNTLQRRILASALEHETVQKPEVLAEHFGWPIHGDAFSPQRFKVVEEIGKESYNVGNATLYRNMRRLREKRLLRKDATLTDAGRAAALELQAQGLI